MEQLLQLCAISVSQGQGNEQSTYSTNSFLKFIQQWVTQQFKLTLPQD